MIETVLEAQSESHETDTLFWKSLAQEKLLGGWTGFCLNWRLSLDQVHQSHQRAMLIRGEYPWNVNHTVDMRTPSWDQSSVSLGNDPQRQMPLCLPTVRCRRLMASRWSICLVFSYAYFLGHSQINVVSCLLLVLTEFGTRALWPSWILANFFILDTQRTSRQTPITKTRQISNLSKRHMPGYGVKLTTLPFS